MSDLSHDAWMRRAIDLAGRAVATAAGGPFGAVVVRDGEVLGEAHNEVLRSRDPTAHAEVLAIRRAAAAAGSYDLSGGALYASCDPCPMCLGAFLWARLDRLYVAATGSDAAEVGFDDESFHERFADRSSLVAGRLLREQARATMAVWRDRDLPSY